MMTILDRETMQSAMVEEEEEGLGYCPSCPGNP